MENVDDRNYWWHKIFFAVTFVTVEPDPMEQQNIMRKMHCGVGTENMSKALAGHHGWDKTGYLISSRWYFPQIYLRVGEMIKYCPQCQSMNTSWLHKASNVLQPIPVPMKCWSMMGVDLVGPLKENNGFCYIVTAVDYTSKWVEAEPIHDKSALSVAQVLFKLLCR